MSAADLPRIAVGVLERVAGGELTPCEGQALVDMLDGVRRAFETADLQTKFWVDALADPGGDGDGANDLADPLARQHVWRWPGTSLTAGE